MSKISDLYIDIEQLLAQGVPPEQVAEICEVPVAWVYEVFMLSDLTEQNQYGAN